MRAPALRQHSPLWRELSADPDALIRAEELLRGESFTFLGQTRVRNGWESGAAPRLWCFHLHYFDYLRDLAVYATHRQRDVAYAAFRELIDSWIDAHREPGQDSWHPYTVSLRVVNWCESAHFFRPELDADPQFAMRLYDSIASQARFLSRHVEHDVRGNHVLENARALVRASAFFEGNPWLDEGLAILTAELPEQVLSDGGHFERAPGYHLRVMCVLQDIAMLHPLPELECTVHRMRAFLEAIVPGNGRLPLLKDTVLATPLRVQAQPSRWLEASGYAVIRDDARGDHLIADFGKVCPDYLPAHAHADLFSFELTIGGRPVLVDSGVYEYAEGEWRNWFRSTAAHNTVSVDGRDQSEMWGSFRVGRRARASGVEWQQNAEWTSIQGQHDGYVPLVHHRQIIALHERRIWIVVDRLSGSPGHVARSFLHLHPERTRFVFEPLGPVTVSGGEGWYSERFGVKVRNRVITLTAASTPATFGYVIAAEDASPEELRRAAAPFF